MVEGKAVIRFGILGAGHWAKRHLDALQRLPNRARVVCVARRQSAPFETAQALGARQVSVEELLASPDVDAVSVCTPNYLHRAHAEAALRAGKHVFCEKPLALTVEDADAAILAAEECGRVLMAGHVTRHITLYRKVAELLASKRLGPPQTMYASRLQVGGGESWRMDPKIGGGAPFDLLIHDFDLMNWYLGRPDSVAARARRHPQGAFDHIAAIFAFRDNAIAVAEGSFLLRPGAGLRAWLRIICERGHIEVDSTDADHPIRVFQENDSGEEAKEQPVSLPAKDTILDAIIREFEEFLDAIEGNPPGRLRNSDARAAVECAALATRAAETGVAEIFP